MNTNTTGRFAPSPSGYLHMGNLLSLLLAWLDCRKAGGTLVFRMEDLDPERSKPEYIAAIGDDLRWLGLDWDTGYPDPSCQQSRRTAFYDGVFRELQRKALVYPCFCTRAQRLAAANAPHAGERQSDLGCPCARLSAAEREALLLAGKRPAWKIRTPDRTVTVTDDRCGTVSLNLAREVGDFLVRRADGVYAYQLAAVADDLVMGVNRVVRGADLLRCVPQQVWLTELLGGTAPSYCHTPLLLSAPGRKLSKRLGSLSTRELRKVYTPEALLGHLAALSGLIPKEEPLTARELLGIFSWEKVPEEDIVLQ